MKGRFIEWIVLVGILLISCNPDEDISFSPNSILHFSTDTVSFDTLLSDTTSFTKRLRISNPNKRAVQVSEIRLARGLNSDYSIIINGKNGPVITNEIIEGGDSILILIDVKIDPRDENLPYLVKDSIVVSWNDRQKDVKLISYGQDTRMLIDPILCDTTWTSDRPLFITESILIDSLCQLTIEKGTQVFLGKGVSIFNKGTLHILGDSTAPVLFSNSRFDENYIEAPGQWGGIFFLEGSLNNIIDYAIIENGEIGIRIGSPDEDSIPELRISHTIIRHMSIGGIMAFTSDVAVQNSLIYNAGEYLMGGFAGGNYSVLHCTFSNQPNFFIRENPSVQFSDHLVLANDQLIEDNLSVQMINSVVWGNASEELALVVLGNTEVNLIIQNNVIRTESEITGNYTSNEPDFPGFRDPFSFDYFPDSLSILIDAGLDIGIIDDLEGKARVNPDIGAYEF